VIGITTMGIAAQQGLSFAVAIDTRRRCSMPALGGRRSGRRFRT